MSDDTRNAPQSANSIVPFAPSADSVRKWRRLVRLRNFFGWIWIGGLTLDILFLLLAGVPAMNNYFMPGLTGLCLCWLAGGFAGLGIHAWIQRHIRRNFHGHHINSLNYWSDEMLPRASISYYPRIVTRNFARERTELLNQLRLVTEETAYLLRSCERDALYKTLKCQDAELISAVLQVVPALADPGALPFFRYLAEGNGAAAANPSMQMEAQSSLKRLQTLLDLSNGAQGLLRASSPPQPPEEQLLHPIQGQHETDPKELLRADVQK